MTANVYPNSPSSEKRDENQSSNEIRADIDQTRSSVGEKIDQLQARLDPNRLKQQAQETVQEMLSDTANSMTDYVRTHRDEMVSSVADAARRNPLPTALVGLGLGWLILESMAGSKRHDDDWEVEQRRMRSRRDRYEGSYEGGRFEASTGRSYVSQGRGQYQEEQYYSPTASNTASNEPDYGRSGYPVRSQSSMEEQRRSGSGNGHQQGENPLAKAAGSVKDAVSGAAGAVKDVVSDAAGAVKDRVEDVKDRVSDVRENVMDTGQQVQGRAQERMGDMRERVDDTMYDVRHQAGQMTQRAGNQMQEWQRTARYQGQRRGKQVINHLEDNPLTYGAVALAAGAALAFLLPQTRTENRAFGEMRDQVMERGQEVFETAKGHAQQVVEEIRPELEEKARQIVSDVKEVGTMAVQDAASELRPVVDKAISRGKEEVRSVAQEAGIDPSKLTVATGATGSQGQTGGQGQTSGQGQTGSQGQMSSQGQNKGLVINRDTLRGQWKEIQGEVKSKWGKLTDDDLTQAQGDYEKLVGSIQKRYGYTREQVDREFNDFFNSHKG